MDQYRATNQRGFISCFGELALSSFAIFLSLQSQWFWWLMGQLILGLSVFQWFVIMHSCGHRSQFRSPWLNPIFGHLASFFCIIPYYPWVYVHVKHHRWTGWVEQDPSMGGVAGPRPNEFLQKLINFCWKFWIPILSLAFALGTFWSPRKIDLSAPSASQQKKTRGSIIFLIISYLIVAYSFGFIFLKIWGLGYLIFLILSDPILLSQHIHLPHKRGIGRPLRPREQELYTRSISLPKSLERWGMLNYNRHSTHHAFPKVPHYDLHLVEHHPENSVPLLQWLVQSKQIKATQLLYDRLVD